MLEEDTVYDGVLGSRGWVAMTHQHGLRID